MAWWPTKDTPAVVAIEVQVRLRWRDAFKLRLAGGRALTKIVRGMVERAEDDASDAVEKATADGDLAVHVVRPRGERGH